MCRNCYAKSKGYVWQKKYQKDNREKATTYAREWAGANLTSVRASRNRWRKANPSASRKYLQTWRKNNKPPFCLICGEDRVCEWAHIIPHHQDGPVAHWNIIPLCPTHHRCFDRNCLTPEELSVISPYIDTAKKEFTKLSSRALVSAS